MADLPRTPITRQEEYLSRLAGENTTLPREPITREEMYLEGAIARVEAVEEEVERLENNPDVVDIVATYADLQAYDKSTLTDKDVIRVLADETHNGNSAYYRYSKSSNDFTFIAEIKSGGREAVVLSTADYNYPESNPSRVATWLLPSGEYVIPQGVTVIYNKNGYTIDGTGEKYFFTVKMAGGTGFGKIFQVVFPTSTEDGSYGYLSIIDGDGNQVGGPSAVIVLRLTDALNKSDPYSALTANQGKVLNTKITPSSGAGAPTSATTGILGKIYVDTDTDTAYMCTKVNGDTYTWKQITN